MLREAVRLIAIAQHFESREVRAVERLHPADRQPDAMNGQCIALAQGAEVGVRRSPSAHIVLCMHLKESDRLFGGENVAKMQRLEADAGARWKICNDGHYRHSNSANRRMDKGAPAGPRA